jgi:DNA-binding GntR family transcriptional regulator
VPRLESLAQPSLRERVVTAVRDAVARGEFRPGQKVPEGELAEQLGVSRTPIARRRVLEYEGLLVTRPKNGTYIAQPDAAALRDSGGGSAGSNPAGGTTR